MHRHYGQAPDDRQLIERHRAKEGAPAVGVCEDCDGRGWVNAYCSCNGSGEGYHDGSICRTCRGRGEMATECDACDGTGERKAPTCAWCGEAEANASDLCGECETHRQAEMEEAQCPTP